MDRLEIAVRGLLDAVVVQAVLAIVAAAESGRPIENDLSGLEDHTDAGVAALAEFIRRDNGVTYRAGSEKGQLALLAIYGDYPLQ